MAAHSGKVAALYRHPVKGMTPEECERLRVTASGAVEGDRVLGFLLGRAGDPPRQVKAPDGSERDWWPKAAFLQLMDTPAVARLDVAYDDASRVLAIEAEDEGYLAAGCVDEPEARATLETELTAWVAALDDSPIREGDPPLRLVGDGVTSLFQDRGPRHVTILGGGSVVALEDLLGAEIDERRFRMNVVLEGLNPWEELSWIGKTIRIGKALYDVTGPVVRCLATHANPETGVRDQEILTTLTRVVGQEQPTMGVLAVPREAGEIALDAVVTVVE